MTNFAYVLPVLFYEYLAISITKSFIPHMIIEAFGDKSYLAIGIVEMIKGIFAFMACPLFGKISDRIGRKYCLMMTVVGTIMPLCIMVFTENMYVYGVMTALSGMFSATFTVTFAYIADCVPQKERAPAYGLALATFGLSFCIGPVAGGYISSIYGNRAVFLLSSILMVVDVLYIIFVLPEPDKGKFFANSTTNETLPNNSARHVSSSTSGITLPTTKETIKEKISIAISNIPNTWDVVGTFRAFSKDDFMFNLGIIVLMYYTAVWALVSTLMVYVTRRLNFDPITVGYLVSMYGLSTMVSETAIVRLVVPRLGETNSMRLGLFAFSMQCIIIAFADNIEQLYFSIVFSMFSNIVYPSISSLITKLVEPEDQGAALGSLNGLKSLTEGVGPLFFGILMARYEVFLPPANRHQPDVGVAPWMLHGLNLAGAPYLVAAFLALWALLHCYELPAEPDDSYLTDSCGPHNKPGVFTQNITKEEELFGTNVLSRKLLATTENSVSSVHSIIHSNDGRLHERKSLLHGDDDSEDE